MKHLFLVLLLSTLAIAGQAKPPAQPPAKAPTPASPDASARAERVLLHLREVELLAKLEPLQMSREQIVALVAALEKAWTTKNQRRTEENAMLARLEQAVREARDAAVAGQRLPADYLEALQAQVDSVLLQSYQQETEWLRVLAQRVNAIFAGAQLTRALPPVPPANSSTGNGDRPGRGPGGLGPGALGPPGESPQAGLARLRTMPAQQYAMTRLFMSGQFRMTPMTAEERQQRQGMLEKLDRVRSLSDGDFSAQSDELATSLREEMSQMMMGDMLRDLRSLPKPMVDLFRPMAINLATQGLDPNAAAQLRDELMQFSDRAREMSAADFEAQQSAITQQLAGSMRKVEELQRNLRAERQHKQATDRSNEHYRKAMEEFVAKTLMHPRTVVLLKERLGR